MFNVSIFGSDTSHLEGYVKAITLCIILEEASAFVLESGSCACAESRLTLSKAT